mmetsp:Transcript_62319/g.147701  ORF Transcript_62319/g.147701 Transcript_62319/m.147701 type:complete len:105 (+) Transcript_62319:821-1135(+)
MIRSLEVDGVSRDWAWVLVPTVVFGSITLVQIIIHIAVASLKTAEGPALGGLGIGAFMLLSLGMCDVSLVSRAPDSWQLCSPGGDDIAHTASSLRHQGEPACRR